MHAPAFSFLNADRTHLIEVGAGATVADVKAAIQAREGEHRCAAARAMQPTGRKHSAACTRPLLRAAVHFRLTMLTPCMHISRHAVAGVDCEEQRVLFNGKQLSDEELLSFAGVEEEATLYFLGALLGGAKKRKKKTYTKPKKQKHKPKKVR